MYREVGGVRGYDNDDSAIKVRAPS